MRGTILYLLQGLLNPPPPRTKILLSYNNALLNKNKFKFKKNWPSNARLECLIIYIFSYQFGYDFLYFNKRNSPGLFHFDTMIVVYLCCGYQPRIVYYHVSNYNLCSVRVISIRGGYRIKTWGDASQFLTLIGEATLQSAKILLLPSKNEINFVTL